MYSCTYCDCADIYGQAHAVYMIPLSNDAFIRSSRGRSSLPLPQLRLPDEDRGNERKRRRPRGEPEYRVQRVLVRVADDAP